MKKQILNIGKALSRSEQKEVFGGDVITEEPPQDSTNAWVTCGNGAMFRSYGCGSYADTMCENHSGFLYCSEWDW
jgi:hypothetical protein